MGDNRQRFAGALSQAHHTIEVETRGSGFSDVTHRVADWLAAIGAENGLITLFIRHTSASLVIQENADPDVCADLADALDRLAPESQRYRHDVEGPDDMPAHIKAMLTATSLAIPIYGGQMALGTWQGVYLIEHRQSVHRREIVLHYVGTIHDR